MSDKLQAAQAQLAAAQAEELAIREKEARAEHEKQSAEREAKAAKEQAELDASRYIGTNEIVDKILIAMGKGIKDPSAPFVVTYLMLTARDAIGQANPRAGILAIESYFRHANSKKEGK